MTGCKTKKEVAKTDTSITTCELLVNDVKLFAVESDAFYFNSVKIEGDCMNIDLHYSGGCGEVDFKLVWDGKIKKSYPPKVTVKVNFVDNDDCENMVQKFLSYDLAPLKYINPKGKLTIIVKDRVETYNYKFQE
ncbi:MAG: hypothetical protein IH946_03465 [Bacteroidetes bacterium]|nr:hypothetical protein [Bacteroidota bacterium]